MKAESAQKRTYVFISYSHADARWRERLDVHLAPLGKDYEIECWSDKIIRPGSKWRTEIRTALEKADVAVLLISADFLASDFIRKHELPPLLKAAEEDGALVLPVIVSPCLFLRTPELAQFQAVNDASSPLISESNGEQEAAFVRVAEAILERAGADRARRQDGQADDSRRESFVDPATWDRLIKIGDWIFDGETGRIIGSRPHAYLLSQREYGEAPFLIETTLTFTNFQSSRKQALGMNAGIVFGWKYEKTEPRYYNILLTGSEVLIERIGFEGEEAGHDFEHVTEPTDLPIGSGQPINFRVSSDDREIKVFAGDKQVLSLARPHGVVGRVGLRPWRSKMDCTKFVVGQ